MVSPAGPMFQAKMWDRAGNDDSRVWSVSCRDRETVFVNFSYEGLEYGTQANPFNTLWEGIATVGQNGTIVLSPGSSAEHFTLCLPVTITSSGGVATIGQ